MIKLCSCTSCSYLKVIIICIKIRKKTWNWISIDSEQVQYLLEETFWERNSTFNTWGWHDMTILLSPWNLTNKRNKCEKFATLIYKVVGKTINVYYYSNQNCILQLCTSSHTCKYWLTQYWRWGSIYFWNGRNAKGIALLSSWYRCKTLLCSWIDPDLVCLHSY